jgi:hypothetical protein
LFLPLPAAATLHYLIATLDGAQEVPVVVTPATGSATITYDDVTNTLSWTISFQDLIGTSTDAHFHGPAAPGVSAGVLVPIPHTDGLTADTLIGSAVISELNETRLLGELMYINIHSTFRPGGEIRGQVLLPEPTTLVLMGAGLVAIARRRKAA